MLIDLENTVFDLGDIIHTLPDTYAFRKGKFVCVKDFGTLFLDVDHIPNGCMEMSMPQPGAPRFIHSEWTHISQVVKALGAFESTTQARKAGWDFEIPLGCSSHIVKIRKMRGEIWIHRGGIKGE